MYQTFVRRGSSRETETAYDGPATATVLSGLVTARAATDDFRYGRRRDGLRLASRVVGAVSGAQQHRLVYHTTRGRSWGNE